MCVCVGVSGCVCVVYIYIYTYISLVCIGAHAHMWAHALMRSCVHATLYIPHLVMPKGFATLRSTERPRCVVSSETLGACVAEHLSRKSREPTG
jgi:hypothetical protein